MMFYIVRSIVNVIGYKIVEKAGFGIEIARMMM